MKLSLSTFTQFTPTVCLEYQEKKYEGQRTFRPDHANYLAGEMKEGRFTTNTIVLAICLHRNNEYVKVNGQHTLEAMIKSGCYMGLPELHYEVSSDEELAALYATLDVPLKRTTADTLGAFKTAELTGLAPASLNKMIAALKYFYAGWPRGGLKRRMSPIKAHELALDWQPFYNEFNEIVNKAHTMVYSRMNIQGTLSIFLPLIRYAEDHSKALAFVSGVALDDGLNQGDPRKALHYHLITTRYKYATEPGVQLNKSISLAVATAWAWNKFYEGNTLKTLNSAVVLQPRRLSIKGTNFIIDSRKPAGVSLAQELYYQTVEENGAGK